MGWSRRLVWLGAGIAVLAIGAPVAAGAPALASGWPVPGLAGPVLPGPGTGAVNAAETFDEFGVVAWNERGRVLWRNFDAPACGTATRDRTRSGATRTAATARSATSPTIRTGRWINRGAGSTAAREPSRPTGPGSRPRTTPAESRARSPRAQPRSPARTACASGSTWKTGSSAWSPARTSAR